jgi:hypothetical protein
MSSRGPTIWPRSRPSRSGRAGARGSSGSGGGWAHASGVLVVAALAFGLRQVVHLEALRGWGERLVGATLIVLGLWGLRSLLPRAAPCPSAPS